MPQGAQHQIRVLSDEIEYSFGYGGRVVVWKSLPYFPAVIGC